MTLAASAGSAIAMGVGGIVAVLAVCAVFYAIGRGEDRDRASAPPAGAPDEPAAAEPVAPEATPPRPRSPRGAPRRRRP